MENARRTANFYGYCNIRLPNTTGEVGGDISRHVNFHYKKSLQNLLLFGQTAGSTVMPIVVMGYIAIQ